MREDPEYFRIVGQIWTDLETIGCTSSFIGTILSVGHFSLNRSLSPNVIYLMTTSEREKLDRLPDRFTVYRGHDDRLLQGIS
jgi:hypothetical protein